jgi:uncharacterized protein (TIGR00730 family)
MFSRIKRAFYEIARLLVGWISVLFQLLYGVWKLSRVPAPRVSFFGGAKLKQDDLYAQDARKLAQRCVDNDISVLTGGGPGIMEAANCGVLDSKKAGKEQRTMGIMIKNLPNEEDVNVCVINYNIVLKYFFARKWLLINYSSAFVIFPGGFGTVDEMAEVLTLIRNKKMATVPVILYDSNFWNFFMQWVDESYKKGLISEEDKRLIIVEDSLDKIFEIVKNECYRSKI